MQNGAKIHLSTQEIELVTNKEWLFLKRSILKKMEIFLGELHKRFIDIAEEELFHFDDTLKKRGGKISRGENYKGLPYLILDYPAKFSKNEVFAVRTLFWWGNFFSMSLHLSGSYLNNCRHSEQSFDYLTNKNFVIYTGNDEWDHDLVEGGYVSAAKLNFDQFLQITENKYLKISKMIHLGDFENAPELLTNYFSEILAFVQISCHQFDEKDL